MESGIYCFENLVNNKKYIGQAENIIKRKKVHLTLLKTNNPKENKYFLNAWEKYGKQNFKFWIVEECDKELLNEREIYWIKKLHSHSTEQGYNLSWGGEAPMRGLNHSEKTKQKMSENHADFSGENHPNFGKPMSKEQKKKISDSCMGNTRWLGKTHTEETKQKLSRANSGEKGYWYGKQRSSKTRAKISASLSGENCYSSKLNETDVLEILDLFYNKNINRKEINKNFYVSYSTICRIISGKTWKSEYKNFTENR